MSKLFIPAIHLANGRDIFRPSPLSPSATKKLLKSFAERGLLECGKEDYIVLPAMPDSDYLEFLLENGIGSKNIIECRGSGHNLAQDILADETAMKELKKISSKVSGVEFYIHLEEEKELAEKLGRAAAMHPDLTRMFNKFYFLARVCEDLDTELPPMVQVRSGRFMEKAQKLLELWGRLFVRGNESVGGIQTFKVENEKHLQEVERKISANSRLNRYFILPWLEKTESWNIQYLFNGNKSHTVSGASLQTLANGTAHFGNFGGRNIEPSEGVCKISGKIAARMAELGAAGFAGIDLMVTKNGEVFPTDINARRNTSTPALSIYKKLTATFPDRPLYFKSFLINAEGGISFKDFSEKVGKKNLFNLNSGEGILPFHFDASRINGKLNAAAFSSSMEELDRLEALTKCL